MRTKNTKLGHLSYERSATATLEFARQTGQKLIEAKSLVPHGDWSKWVEQKLPFGIDTAERYMRIRQGYSKLKSAPVPILTIKGALEYLAKPRDKAEQTEAEAHAPATGEDRTKSKGQTSDAADGAQDECEGDTDKVDTAADYTAALKQHKLYCRRLRPFAKDGHLTPNAKPVQAQVDAVIDGIAKEVVAILRRHGRKLCSEAVKANGYNGELVAMVLALRLKERLDPEALFAPEKPPNTAE